MHPTPIPTLYRGGQYRSRLEARWAAFFDLAGLPYIYEPSDHGGYVPDFLIPGKNPLFVEVGPVETLAEYEAKAAKPIEFLGGRDFIVLGTDPLARRMDVPLRSDSTSIIGLQYQGGNYIDDEGQTYGYDGGNEAHLCYDHHGHLAIVNMIMSYTPYPCGCGDHSGWWGYEINAGDIERWWREAGSLTQWKSSRA
jgi:hypothetical protein